MIDITKIEPNKINANLKSKFFLFYGEPGTWKTTTASQFPRPLFLAFEIGYQFIEGVKAQPISHWSELKQIYRQLKLPKSKELYDTIVFDTISKAYTLCQEYVLGQCGVSDPSDVPHGQFWSKLKKELSLLVDISKLGYGIVFIAHGKEVEQNKIIKQKISLESTGLDIVNGLTDFSFFVNKETNPADPEGPEVVYAYSTLRNGSAKKRLANFPDKILFTADNIIKALEESINAAAKTGVSNENIRVVEDVDFELVKKEVISLATELLANENFANSIHTKLLETFNGVKVSDITKVDLGKMIVVRDFLLDLKAS